MKKFFTVFCLLALLATLFSCHGVPALASTKNTPKLTETKAKKTKKVKSGRKTESVDVLKYVKKGVFDYEAYSKAIKADSPFYNGKVMNFAFGDYIVEISTSLKDPEETEFYIGVGTLENDPMLGEITYFSLFKNWEGSVSVKDGNDVNVPKNGLKLLNRVVDYVHTLKHPDPHKKPKIKGFNFLDWDKMPKAADSD